MITPQLIDFIKQSLLQGATKEKITADLVSNGWSLIDVEQGFGSLNNPSPSSIPSYHENPIITEQSNSGKKPFVIIVLFLLLVSGASGYYFRNDLPIIKDFIKSDTSTVGEITQNQTGQAIPEQPIVTETTPTQDSSIKTEETLTPTVNHVVANNVATTETGPIDCGKDMACFMKAIKTCSPVVLQQTQTLPIFGINHTSNTEISLNGFNSSKKCVYSNKILTAKIEYSQEMKDSILSQLTPELIAKKRSEPDFPEEYKNLSDEELRKKAIEVPEAGIDSVKSTIGMITKCSFTTTYLTELYTKWAEGKYNSKDLDPGNCEYSEGDKPSYRSKIGLYYDDSGSSISTDGYNFKLIKINENQIELKIIKESTKETKNITLVLKQAVKLFGATFSLQEIKKDDIGLLAWIGIL